MPARTRTPILLAPILLASALAAAYGPLAGGDPDGAHPVGFRWIEHHDHTRSGGAPYDFEGRPTGAPGATVLGIAIWYPARADAPGSRMRHRDYRSIVQRRDLLNPAAPGDTDPEVTAVRDMARFGLETEISPARARAILEDTLLAIRDAPPANGRFPLVLGGLGRPHAAARLAEHLASHGYVVVSTPPSPRAVSLQVTNRPAALQLHTRNLEAAHGYARSLELVDTLRLAVIGVNFDGPAALEYQLRNMDAAAVITLDGWEGKPIGSGTLIGSPWFDVRRLRVPYLAFLQDEPPRENLAPDDVALDSLRYADRATFVVEGMTHAHYIDDHVALAVEPERGPAHQFVLETVRSVLDTKLAGGTGGGSNAALAALERSERDGAAAGLLASADVRPGLTPVPTASELERLVMSGDIARVRAVVERARHEDSSAVLFTPRDVRLYAFRFAQRERWDVVTALLELGLEAYPMSSTLREALDEAYRRAGECVGVRVTPLVNEGVLLESAAGGVLIDALFREGVEPYPTPTPEQRRRLESAAPPFDRVRWVLATHEHADHFDAEAVAAHLRANPRARFASTRAAVESVRRAVGPAGMEADRLVAVAPVEGPGAGSPVSEPPIRIEALSLHHGRDRSVENVGFLVEMAGLVFLHMGDSEATAADLRALDLRARGIDVAFVPTWYLFSEGWRPALEEIGADTLAVVHFPQRSHRRGFVERHGGWEGVFRFLAEHDPPAIPFNEETPARCLPLERGSGDATPGSSRPY